MSLKETLKQNLGWNSLIGLVLFFMGVGSIVWSSSPKITILAMVHIYLNNLYFHVPIYNVVVNFSARLNLILKLAFHGIILPAKNCSTKNIERTK